MTSNMYEVLPSSDLEGVCPLLPNIEIKIIRMFDLIVPKIGIKKNSHTKNVHSYYPMEKFFFPGKQFSAEIVGNIYSKS